MADINKVAKELKRAMDTSDARKPKSYDTEAVVTRVEGNTLWVKFPGGETETPVRRTIDAKAGDSVMVRVVNHRAWTAGNSTSPPTDDTTANKAQKTAQNAEIVAKTAREEAESAHEAAVTAWGHATEAEKQAIRATGYANDSLAQLGIVEDVVGTLNWISTHATYKPTEDSAVRAGKWYFTKSGDIYNIVINPSGDPSANGWYEIDTIDEAVSNYVASHLALTDEGLWVVNDNNSYKILLASDGMKVYDSEGNLVSTFGESIIFDSSRPQYIGGENAFIIFADSDGDSVPDTITIGGNVVMSGSNKTLSETINELNANVEGALTYDHEYKLNSDKTIATFTAHVYRGGVDVTDKFEDEQFTWYYKTEDNIDPQPINRSANNDNYGKTMTVLIADMGYGGEIVGKFSTISTRRLLRSNGDTFTDTNGRKLLAKSTASGDEVRVRDLTYTTTLYSTDGILVVQSEEERLATIASLADAIWTEYGITIEDEPLLQGNNVYEDIGLGRITNSEIEALSI